MWRSMRARATIGATAVTAAALGVGAFGFASLLSTSVYDASLRTAETRAEEIADRVDAEGPGFVSDLEDLVQVIEDGRAVAASDDAEGVTLPSEDGNRTVTVDDDPYLVTAEEGDGRTVVVGVSVEDDAEVTGTVRTMLLIAVPALIALVGLVTWVVVGRALRPVERIRREVDRISGAHLHRRIDVPPTGDEIAALAGTMNSMLDRVDAAATAQRRFVSDASHELRSPLATIRQHAEVAASHPDATSLDEFGGLVRAEGLRLQGLVDSLLVLARLDEGATSRVEPVDLDDLALAAAARVRAGGRQVDTSGIGPARVDGDPLLLDRVVRNLVDNAARHCRERIAVAVSEVADAAVIVVEDDGAGVPVEERERVFERFVRLDEGRSRDAGGSGLGLAIVRAVAVAAGGAATADTSRWGGARFTVTLPRAT